MLLLKKSPLYLSFLILFVPSCESVDGLSSDPIDAELSESTVTFTMDEAISLTFMAEEEKLARDTYLYLYELWSHQAFNNIASSEQKHMDAVSSLMMRAELRIPSTMDQRGVFEDQVLQSMYDELVSTGSVSLIEALKVGALIEEVDIKDLDEVMEDVVTHPDILAVYTSLKAGSENHLRAFVKNLNNSGVTYSPQILSQEQYDAIIQ
jgi:hypothetical protein